MNFQNKEGCKLYDQTLFLLIYNNLEMIYEKLQSYFACY